MSNRIWVRLFYSFGAALLVLSIGFVPVSEGAAAKATKIILIETMPVPVVKVPSKWFQVQIKELGYINGENLELKVIEANGDRVLAEKLLKEALAKGKPDLVATVATVASQTALKLLKGTDVPILFFLVDDPVGAGLIEKIGEPTGNNITGLVNTISRDHKIDMVMQLVGSTKKNRPIKFGYIHSTYPSAMGDLHRLLEASKNRNDVKFIPYQIPYKKVPAGADSMVKDARAGIQELKNKVDFWWMPTGALSQVPGYLTALQEDSSLEVVYGTTKFNVKQGVLMYVAPDLEAEGREAAILADVILKGKNPGQIPVKRSAKFILGLNTTIAHKLNIIIPPDLLELAEGHLYR